MPEVCSTEEWRPVVGFEGLYEVSDLGRVRSLDHVSISNGTPWLRRGRVLKVQVGSSGYPQVALHRDGRQQSRSIHTLVLEAFVGLKPQGHAARHMNGDRQDPRAANLAWGTYTENSSDILAHGRRPYGERSGSTRLTAEQVLEIRRRRPNETLMSLAAEFGVCKGAISNIVARRNWAHI